MHYPKTKLALAIIASAGLAACGGGSSGGGGGGGGGTSGPDAQNWQTDFSNTDRYNVTEAPGGFSINQSTLAINTSETVDSAFDGPFESPNGNSVTPDAYFGAVDPSAADADDDPNNDGPFWDGWTIRDADIDGNLPGTPTAFHPLEAEVGDGTLSPNGSPDCSALISGLDDGGVTDIFGVDFPVCVITDGDLESDITLTNDYVYVLDGTVQVGNGDVESASDPGTVDEDVLTIEEGTQIFGAAETDPSLVITRGSRIEAVGTADLPIIFGGVAFDSSAANVITDDATDLSGRGEWGSLVVSGYGEINNGDDNNQTTTEAVPDGVTRWFGGTDNADSSGTIEYVVLAETGEAFRPDEEVQGLTIEAAGSGTTISHVQVTNSDDDGFEWFGGAASADNVVLQGVSDDSLDQDLGWQGTVKKALVIQGTEFGDRGMETDNNGDDFAAMPKTSPRLVNVTVLGNAGNGGTADANTMGALHREGYGGKVFRSVYTDDSAVNGGQFDLGCLDVDSEVDEDLEYGDVLFNCAAGALVDDED